MPASAPPQTTIRRFAGPLVALITVVLTLIVVEVAFGQFWPIPDPYASAKAGLRPLTRSDDPLDYIPRSRKPLTSSRFTAEEGLPGMSGISTFTTNEFGFRGPPLAIPKERSEFRVFLVGGSTTECMFIDDSRSPERVLQDLLQNCMPGHRVRVYNAGVSGARSYDHVAIVAHRIAQLEPDLIVVFAGANDQRAAILNSDYLLPHRDRPGNHSFFLLLGFAATEFQVPRLLHAVLHRLTGLSERERLEQIPFTTPFRKMVELSRGKPISDKAPRTDVIPFGRNLATLAGITKAQGAQMLFVTQASTWNSQIDPNAVRWHWLNYVDGTVYREDLMDRALEAYNEEMRRVAVAQGVPVLEVAHLIPKSLEYFYDDMHFNPKGVALYASLVARCLAEQGLLPAISAKD
jgi:lysophospholipase L1-like esterase